MKQNYNDCLTRLLKDEGGYTNDPSDSGGATNFGITIKDYRDNLNPQGTANDVRNMHLEDAKRIYKTKYWDALNCDNLSSGVDYTCFDYGVNSGVGRPRKALQQFKSLKGIKLIDAINNERTAFLEALIARRPKDAKFRNGWTRRVNGVRAYSKKLAGQDNTTGPIIGGSTITLGAMLSQFFATHTTAIIIGSVIAAIAIGVAVHFIKNRNK